MVNATHFEVENRPKKYGPSAIQPSVGDAGAPVFTFIGNFHLLIFTQQNICFPPDKIVPKGETMMKEVSAAVLLGVISTDQFMSLNHKSFARSQKREQMSDQVVSRVVPVMKWIKKHIQKDHFCIPRA